MIDVRITGAALDPTAELAALPRHPGVGAVASFVGYCRAAAGDEAVIALHLEEYPQFTAREINRIARAVSAKYALERLLVVHRVGVLAPGEPIVLVAAASAHRMHAFAAVEAMMDYLKTDAPFWKRERRASGSVWIEPSEEDRRRRAARSDT